MRAPRALPDPRTAARRLGAHGRRFLFPVLLAAALLLPPSAAALTALPGALLARVEQRPSGVRRVWRTAQLLISVSAAALVAGALGSREALGKGPDAPDFPYALLPAAASALTFCLVLTALDGGVRIAAERIPPRTAWRGHLGRTLAPHAVHGLAGLMMAVLWRSTYGPVAALFVLLPMYISCWVFASTTGNAPRTRRPSARSCRPSTSRTGTRAGTANASAGPRC